MKIVGIESTAHTFGVAIFDNKKNKILANEKAYYKPAPKEGIIPRVAAEHHSENAANTILTVLKKAKMKLEDIDAIAYSAGPGLGPCLQTGATVAAFLSKKFSLPLVPVNHCFAHIQIAKWQTKFRDPLILYVSGGNTQIIIRDDNKEKMQYTVIGETLDIGIGNLFDSFAREIGIKFAHGSTLAKKAKKAKRFHLMPYTVKGMNFTFSGLFTYASKKIGKIDDDELCYSLMETAYAELCEALERALMLTNKKEILVCGGVAQSNELMHKIKIMAKEHNIKSSTCDAQYNADNGAMIAYAGSILLNKKRIIKPENVWFNQKWRIDSKK